MCVCKDRDEEGAEGGEERGGLDRWSHCVCVREKRGESVCCNKS